MTGKIATKFLPRAESEGGAPPPTLREWAAIIPFGAVQWPWLLRSLSGGDPAERTRLLERLDLPERALPTLGSWKADAALLHSIVDVIERDRPETVVELGAGATTLITARALKMHGGGRLVSFDQHGDFIGQTRKWLGEYGLDAEMHGVEIARGQTSWPGFWYVLEDVPEHIGLLTIDGPPWTIHPLVRGAADSLFDRIVPGGTVLLDDAARPGERVIAARWTKKWPEFSFRLDNRGTKGTLIGTRRN
jgi:predicted O-methyltransferase YrrM